MIDIVFINPPYDSIAPGHDFVKHITNRSPSLGLLHLAARVRADGYRPAIIESDIENLSPRETAERAARPRPRYVGLTLFTTGVQNAVEIARLLKQELPDIWILVGGPHISALGRETLARFPEFDLAVPNEGESVLSALLPTLDAGGDLASVRGIIYRRGSEIHQTPPAPPLKTLDDLPWPAWDLLPDFPARYLPAIYDYPRGPVATLAASRGCPFHCAFCDTSTFGSRVRYYSPAMLFKILRHLRENHGVRHVQFVDDLFVASRARVQALCELLIQNRLGLTWSCAARADTVTPELLANMKAAGCWEISYGLETGSEELLRRMEKSASLSKSEQAVLWTHAAGIRVKGLFMLGYPGESRRSIEATRAYLKRLPLSTLNMTKFTPYPGSPIHRELYGGQSGEEHWNSMNSMNFIWIDPELTQNDLTRAYHGLLRSFYARPGVLLRYLMISLQYPLHLLRLWRFILAYFWANISGKLKQAQ